MSDILKKLQNGTGPLSHRHLAALLNVSKQMLAEMVTEGVVPRPSYWVMSVDGRWKRQDLTNWVLRGGLSGLLQWQGERGYDTNSVG